MPSSACKTCARSEEHTSELQSHDNLVCRLLLEKKHHTQAVPPDLTARPPTRTSIQHQPARWAACACGDTGWRAGPGVVAAAVRSFFFFNDRAPPKISLLPLPAPFPI